MAAPSSLIERIYKNGDPNAANARKPLVSLEEFFEGNVFEGSIGCNLFPHPGIANFYSTLSAIREREQVADLRVGITANDDEDWPFSDAIYLVTSADEAEVSKWLSLLEPDEVFAVSEPEAIEPIDVPPGHRLLGAWWD